MHREYTPNEIKRAARNSGFEVTLLETGPFREEPKPEWAGWSICSTAIFFRSEHRGDGIYAVGRKTGPVKERYPAWLYA